MVYLVTFGREGDIAGIFLNEANAKECKNSLERSNSNCSYFVKEVESDMWDNTGNKYSRSISKGRARE